MTNSMERDEDAEMQGQSFTERANGTYSPAVPETRHLMYPPPLPKLFTDYHKISLNSLNPNHASKPKINIHLSALK